MAATIAVQRPGRMDADLRPFGAPRLGIVGSGLATSLSSIFSFMSHAGDHPVRRRSLRVYRMFRRFHRPVRGKLAEVFRLGVPIGDDDDLRGDDVQHHDSGDGQLRRGLRSPPTRSP